MSGRERAGPTLRYRAFISYNHGDKKVARLLERRLERFVLPRGLRRVKPGLRHDARPLRPLFRDDDEMFAGQDLIARVGEALEQSETLIVICSPRSAQSPWVQKEVATFMAMRRGAVIPVVVEGEPHSSHPKRECFCPALREAAVQGADGVAHEHLWVDWRGSARHKRRNLLSIVAGLMRLDSLDDLLRRDAQARRGRALRQALTGLCILLLMGVAAAYERVREASYRADVLADRALEANLDRSYERAARFAMAGLNLREAYGQRGGPSKAETQLRRAMQSVRFSPVTLEGHAGPVDSVVYLPDGSRLISASGDGSICTWNSRTGAKLSCFDRLPSPVRALALSADGQVVAAGSEDGSIRLIPAQGGPARVLQASAGSAVRALAFRPDGRMLAAGAPDGAIQLWEVGSGRKLGALTSAAGQMSPLPQEVVSLSFDRDGHKLAAAYSGMGPIVWNLTPGAQAKHLENLDDASAVVFSPDGRYLAVGRKARVVEVLNASDYSDVNWLTGLDDPPTSLSFSPDSSLVAIAGGESNARVFNVTTGREVARVADLQDTVTSVAYSPDGRQLATAAANGELGLAEELPSRLDHPRSPAGLVTAVAYSPNGKRLAFAAQGGAIHLADAATLEDQLVLKAPGQVTAIAFSPDGRRLAAATGARTGFSRTPLVWDLATGRAAFAMTGKGHKGAIRALAFSPDGRWLGSGGDDAAVLIWNARTGKLARRLAGHTRAIEALAFSPDGARLATGSKDRTARIWDTRTWKERARLVGHSEAVTSLAFAPDGRTVATGSDDRTVRLWRTSTGQELERLTRADLGVQALAWSRDGREIVVATDVLDVFDAATGEEIARLSDPDADDEEVQTSVVISPDDRRIASGWREGVDVWDLSTTVIPLPTLMADACRGMLKGRSRFDASELDEAAAAQLDPDLDADVCRPQPLWAHWLRALGQRPAG